MVKLQAAIEHVGRILDFTAEHGFENEEVEFCREVSYALYWICRNIVPVGFTLMGENREKALHASEKALKALTDACKAYEKEIFCNRIEAIREGMRCMNVFHRAKEIYLVSIRDHSNSELPTSQSEISHS